MKKVSIIVPIYNSAQYLDRCLTSLVNQTLKDIEIILVNDASLDDSIYIMKHWGENYPGIITIIDSKVNLRQGGARNLGLNIAKGEYIAFVDSDDWIELDAMEMLYNKVIYNKVDVVYSTSYYRVYENGQKNIEKTVSHIINGNVSDTERKKIIVDNFSVWNCLYNYEWLKKGGLRFIERLAYEDNLWSIEIVVNVKTLACVDFPFYNYYFNMESTINNVNSLAITSLHYKIIAEKLLEYATKYLDVAFFKEEIEYLYIYFFYIALIPRAYMFEPINYDFLEAWKKYSEKCQIHINMRNKYFLTKTTQKQRLKLILLSRFPKFCYFLKKSRKPFNKFIKGV